MSRFEAGTVLTVASARAVLADGLTRIGAGATEVDCATLTQFDSSALAVLLAWKRAAHLRGAAFAILNLPPKLASLAQAYGVAALVEDRH